MNDKALADLIANMPNTEGEANLLRRLVAAEQVLASEHTYPTGIPHSLVANCPKCMAMKRWMDIREGTT